MKKIKIALVGQPNVGKSLLINALCKANMKIGNFSGVTIEKASAKTFYKNYEFEVIDLPGTYSLDGYSEEEKITCYFLNQNDYDVIVNVLDATNLERNLILSAELLSLNKKMLLALNMCEEAKKEERNLTKKIDALLIHKFFGLPIFLFLMWLLFQLTFSLGQIPMDYIESGFNTLGELVKNNISNIFIASALADGILHKFGLHGKSFIPLITGFGCSVPAFIATRTLKNKRDRLLTLFI